MSRNAEGTVPFNGAAKGDDGKNESAKAPLSKRGYGKNQGKTYYQIPTIVITTVDDSRHEF